MVEVLVTCPFGFICLATAKKSRACSCKGDSFNVEQFGFPCDHGVYSVDEVRSSRLGSLRATMPTLLERGHQHPARRVSLLDSSHLTVSSPTQICYPLETS